MWSGAKVTRRRLGAALGAGAAMAALAFGTGCGADAGAESLVAGKEAFIEKCGSCHILERAGTKGITGPNLDQAFQNALKQGFERDTVEGIVLQQILYPSKDSAMPAKLAEGDLAASIAAYVADAVDKRGKDEGVLADVGKVKQKPLAVAKAGKLDIPADPGGQLLYVFKNAEAPPGALAITSPNEAQIPHNIAIDGPGAKATGEVVQGGGISKVDVTVAGGKYQFFCTVPGHREAGMAGVLTVK